MNIGRYSVQMKLLVLQMYGEKLLTTYICGMRRRTRSRNHRAQDLWLEIMESQIETGTPYMVYKIPAIASQTSKI